MKHLLIILSILLLSYPVIGDNQKGETLYEWEISPFVFVWKKFGDKETHLVYKGEVRNGVPHGLGIKIYKFGTKYVGNWKNGERNGFGKTTTYMGITIEGEFKDDGIWNGTQYDKDGNIIGKNVKGVLYDKDGNLVDPPHSKTNK